MSTTIKDIAKKAGVSVATVSHVINRTRYVSPELVQKVEQAIAGSDYEKKIQKKASNMKIGRQSTVAIVLPSAVGTLFTQLLKSISDRLAECGYLPSAYFSNGEYDTEKGILNRIAMDKKVAGIILCPCKMEKKYYEKLLARNIPVVFLERKVKGREEDCVLAENEKGLYKGTKHLIKNGHEKIGFLISDAAVSSVKERLDGYKRALEDSDIAYDERNVLSIDRKTEEEVYMQKMRDFYQKRKPTAIISGGNKLTFMLLKTLQYMGVECPQDVSVIGFGDEEWCELLVPPLTAIKQDAGRMGYYAVQKLVEKMEGTPETKVIRVPTELVIRKSTQMIGAGPFGEKAFSPDQLILSEEEKGHLLESDYRVAISFHYSGTAWERLHEKGIRQTLEMLGVTVVSVTDARFDPQLQITQLEGIAMQRPDALIAIPADDKVTAGTFKKLSKETKLIFLSNVPYGFGAEDYVSCVSVNERENGRIAGMLMGEYYKNQKHVKVGFINHGASFYGTYLRDGIATQVICENYANIEIVSVGQFQNIDDTYEICKNMITSQPQIQGLYVSWDRPALGVIRALKEMGREDISIFTFDLDEEICQYLVREEFVKGMSTQRPYEQGVAVALATAKALLGENEYKYIAVSPCLVQKKNLMRAWKEVMHEPAPKEWEKYFG